MNTLQRYVKILVALLISGSAILLISCESLGETEEQDLETLMTQQSDSLTIVASENGRKSNRFETPLMERYEMAKEPYMEFRKGINVTTYDSLGNVETTIVADYAINFENQKLWETKGNVVVTNANGQILETQQLFWNQKTKKIYSNVDSKVTQEGMVFVGVGFESDESFQYTFRKPKGKVLIDVEPTDTTAQAANTTKAPQPEGTTAKAAQAKSKHIKGSDIGATNVRLPIPSPSSNTPPQRLQQGRDGAIDRERLPVPTSYGR